MIYTEPEWDAGSYECFCLGVLGDGFKTKKEAYQWAIGKLIQFLGLYVDWSDPDSNLLSRGNKLGD